MHIGYKLIYYTIDINKHKITLNIIIIYYSHLLFIITKVYTFIIIVICRICLFKECISTWIPYFSYLNF